MFQLTRTSSPDPRLQPWNKSRRLNEQLGSVAGRARTPARQPAGCRRYIPRSISSEEKTMGLRNRTVSLTLLVTATLLASIGALKVSIKEYDVPTPKARPHDPAVSPDGALWVTEQMANKLGRLDPNTGQFREYPLKTPESGPHGLVADKQGNIWFAAIFKGYIGHFDPKSQKHEEWPSPGGSGSEPYGITTTPDGMIWYSESGVNPNTLVRFDPKAKGFAKTAIPSGGGVVRNMAATKDGKIYLACSGVNKVAVVTP